MKKNENFQWYMTKPNFFTPEECDTFIERVKNTEKGETGCIEPHLGSDHNLEFRSVTEWYLHKDMRDYAKGDYSDIQQRLFVAAKVRVADTLYVLPLIISDDMSIQYDVPASPPNSIRPALPVTS